MGIHAYLPAVSRDSLDNAPLPPSAAGPLLPHQPAPNHRGDTNAPSPAASSCRKDGERCQPASDRCAGLTRPRDTRRQHSKTRKGGCARLPPKNLRKGLRRVKTSPAFASAPSERPLAPAAGPPFPRKRREHPHPTPRRGGRPRPLGPSPQRGHPRHRARRRRPPYRT